MSSPSRPAEPAPPPPGGVLWSEVGDIRTLLTLPAALAMQVAHPAVGAGVDEFSDFRTDPWGRAERSLWSLQLWVYGGDAAVEEGSRLRALHRGIEGTDTRGRHYRALAPHTYAWVHATGFPVFLRRRTYLGRPYTEAQQRQLYGEWLQVGRVLGIDDRDMPQTVEAFWPYYRRMLADEIEATPLVRELTDVRSPVPAPDRGPRVVRLLVRALWPVLLPPLARFRRFVTVGLMPPDAREAMGLEWTDSQERALRRFGRFVGAVVPVLPERLRYLPLARAARARHRVRRTPGAPDPSA